MPSWSLQTQMPRPWLLQALLILVLPGFLRHALRRDRPDLPVTDANGQYIAGGGAAGAV
jgi:hypothetical protein